MNHSCTISRTCVLVGIAAFTLIGCNNSSDPAGSGGNKGSGTGGVTSNGGSSTGGTSSTGGKTETGGSTASGGSSNTGGMTASGGTNSTGGTTGAGGTIAAGGTVGSGGAPATGGSTGSGGMAGGPGRDGGMGGMTVRDGGPAETSGSGGSTGTGGSAGAGGSTTPAGGKNSIAYTGCSMANNIGNGNKRVGNGVMWNSDSYGTGAMVVQNWTSSSSSSWSLFDQKMNSIGGKSTVKGVVVQICIFSSRATDDEVKQMIAAAKAHTNPGTHLYLVGQPQYEAGHECSLAGDGGAKWTDDEAKKIAADSSVGSDVSYLGQFILNSTKGEVMSDSCHVTSSGEDVMARQANAFFPAN